MTIHDEIEKDPYALFEKHKGRVYKTPKSWGPISGIETNCWHCGKPTTFCKGWVGFRNEKGPRKIFICKDCFERRFG